MYETILVPTDGTESGERAVDRALNLARRTNATVHALYVVDTDRYCEPAISASELVVDLAEDSGDEYLEGIVERAAKIGVEVVPHCRHGRPHETIVEAARELDADLIVMGHGRRRERTPGRTTKRVVQGAGREVITE